MLRTGLVLAALLIFPGIALAQQEAEGEAEEPHTVERGESLWNLARRYYEDPFQWRRILEANREKIDDPHWIYPGQEFFIPGVGTVITGVDVEGAEQAGAGRSTSAAAGLYPGPGDRTVFSNPAREDIPAPSQRTTFYGSLQDQQVAAGGVLVGDAVEHLVVSRHDFYSAPWRVPETRADLVSYPGRIEGWAGVQSEGELRETLVPHDRVEISWSGESPPAEGSHLQLVRAGRSQDELGTVIDPTGLARVVERGSSSVVAVILNAFLRPRMGDLVVPAERFPLEPGQYAQEITGDTLVTTLVGFAAPRRIQQIGDIAFVDSGAQDDVRVGDVFSAEVRGDGGWTAQEAVRYRAIRVFEDRASIQVVHVTMPTFRPGTELRRIRRMP